MSTTLGTVLNEIAVLMQEDGSNHGSTDWESGLWSGDEIIDLINAGSKQFVLDTQIIKLIAAAASVAGQRIYADPSYTMQIDRIAFGNRPTYRTTRMNLDRETPKWRTMSGVPRKYHQDQLSTKHFEADRAPTSAMTGTGYAASGSYGTLRGMSGSLTYTASLPAGGGGGVLRYVIGTRAYNGILPHDRPYAGTLRQMLSGQTNFEILATRLMDDVTGGADLMRVPDYALMYVKFWVMWKALEKEGEGQDLPRSKYCKARYDFGVQLFQRAISSAFDQVSPQSQAVQK